MDFVLFYSFDWIYFCEKNQYGNECWKAVICTMKDWIFAESAVRKKQGRIKGIWKTLYNFYIESKWRSHDIVPLICGRSESDKNWTKTDYVFHWSWLYIRVFRPAGCRGCHCWKGGGENCNVPLLLMLLTAEKCNVPLLLTLQEAEKM